MALSIIAFAVALFLSLILIPLWIRKAESIGLEGRDVHKKSHEKVAEAGGVAVIFSAIFGMLVYIFINTFIIKTQIGLVEMLAVILTLILAGFVGFIDDILGWKKGLKQFHKFLFTIPIAIPLAVVNAGTSDMVLPLIGMVDFGLLYPLVIIPLEVIFATNAFNMLAGYNGLEAGNGIIILITLAFVIWMAGNFWVAVLALTMAFALFGFLIFNRFPSKIFPGDTLTYSVGAFIAGIAIIGNAERAAIILFLPYIAEFFLKARGGFKKESFAKVQKDGSLEMPYNSIYSLTHEKIWLLKKLKRKVYERDVVYSLWLTEIVLALIVIFI